MPRTPEEARAYYAANRLKQIEAAKQWRNNNREQNNVTRRARYAANREKEIAKIHAWREANEEMLGYTDHKSHAKQRGIPFLLSFEEWCTIWRISGKWEQRGHSTGQYVMARFGDTGPYAVGNVKIITCNENVSEAHLGKPKPRKRFSHL